MTLFQWKKKGDIIKNYVLEGLLGFKFVPCFGGESISRAVIFVIFMRKTKIPCSHLKLQVSWSDNRLTETLMFQKYRRLRETISTPITISNQPTIHRTHNLDFIFINSISRTDILSNLIETTFDVISRNPTVNVREFAVARIFLGEILIATYGLDSTIFSCCTYILLLQIIFCAWCLHQMTRISVLDYGEMISIIIMELAKHWVHLDILLLQMIHQVTQQMRFMKTLSILTDVTRMVTNSGQMILMYHAENFCCLFESLIKQFVSYERSTFFWVWVNIYGRSAPKCLALF